MTTTVKDVTMYGTDFNGRKFPYKAKVSERTFNTPARGRYFARQIDTGSGVRTELYNVFDDGSKQLWKEKLNIGNSIYRDTYEWFGNKKEINSLVPKNGIGEFYFKRLAKDGKLTDVLSGYMGKEYINVFKMDADIIGNQTGRLLGGGGKRILQKIAKFILKIR